MIFRRLRAARIIADSEKTSATNTVDTMFALPGCLINHTVPGGISQAMRSKISPKPIAEMRTPPASGKISLL